VASNWGLVACVFFLAEGFYGETFLFCGVTISVGGYFGGVASPPPCSSPPSFPSTLSPPPPSEPYRFSSEALSSSSVSIFWNSSYLFFFFVPLDCSTCSTWVTMGLPMVSVSENSASTTGTRNSSGHSFVIFSMYSSISL
jgi:hypothetical protein